MMIKADDSLRVENDCKTYREFDQLNIQPQSEKRGLLYMAATDPLSICFH
jgi:hypothetical protein